MKKIKYLLLLCLFTIILTGCVKFNANMDIKKDKSMDFSIIYAFDKTVFGESNTLKEEDFAEVKKQGFTVTKYSEGNYEGFTLTKKIANIDEVSTESDTVYDLSGMMSENASNNYIFKVLKADDKNTYTAKIKFNANDSGLNSSDEETPDEVVTTGEDTNTIGALDDATNEITSDNDSSLDYTSLMQNMDLSFNVTLPNSAITSNATKKENDDKKLSWALTTSGEEYIEFSFALSNKINDNMILYIGIGVVALALIIVVAIVLLKGKKKTDYAIEPEPKKLEENK